jgi:hypothetical protein
MRAMVARARVPAISFVGHFLATEAWLIINAKGC